MNTLLCVRILLEGLASSRGHSGGQAFAVGCGLPRLPLVLVQRREGVHAICALARVVERVATNAERLLAAGCQLSLLMCATNVH